MTSKTKKREELKQNEREREKGKTKINEERI